MESRKCQRNRYSNTSSLAYEWSRNEHNSRKQHFFCDYTVHRKEEHLNHNGSQEPQELSAIRVFFTYYGIMNI